MKKLILTVTTVLTAQLAFAQAPATDPAAPAATTTPPAAAAKPYSSGDVQKIGQIADGVIFSITLGERAKWKGKEDKDLGEWGARLHKEAADLWTPLVNMAQAHKVDGKYIPSGPSKGDMADLDRAFKAKGDNFKVEFVELFAKTAKKNARIVEAAAKGFNDPELKEWGVRATKVFNDQADFLEKEYKELKKKK